MEDVDLCNFDVTWCYLVLLSVFPLSEFKLWKIHTKDLKSQKKTTLRTWNHKIKVGNNIFKLRKVFLGPLATKISQLFKA